MRRLPALTLAPALAVLCLLAAPASAKQAAPLAEDPLVEARVMDLAAELRCLVCQNQSLADSHADLAKDLRQEVREMVQQGLSNDQIVEYLTDRYGDFIRYRPPLKATTVMLWFGPALLVVVGGTLLGRALGRRRREALPDDAPLSPEEAERVRALLREGSDGEGKG
jgi:cytochrome c-type biogenesis protein CcmH